MTNRELTFNPYDIEEFDSDIEILDSTHKEIKELENELIELNDLMRVSSELTFRQSDNLNEIEEKIDDVKNEIELEINNIKDTNEIDTGAKFNMARVVGAGIVNGATFGGIGAFFGVFPALAATGIGTGAGCVFGAIYNYFKNDKKT